MSSGSIEANAAALASAPDVLHRYMAMWNERDVDQVRTHLDACVSESCLWVDPQHQHTGRDALEANVRAFRGAFPDAYLGLASNVDGHNDRYRYEWLITTGEGADTALLIRGFDVATLDSDGLIERVDGFFGRLDPFGLGLETGTT